MRQAPPLHHDDISTLCASVLGFDSLIAHLMKTKRLDSPVSISRDGAELVPPLVFPTPIGTRYAVVFLGSPCHYREYYHYLHTLRWRFGKEAKSFSHHTPKEFFWTTALTERRACKTAHCRGHRPPFHKWAYKFSWV